MSSVDDVYSELSSSSSLEVLVSDRIYLIQADVGANYPLIVISPISEEPLNTLAGDVTNVSNENIQFDIYSKTFAEAQQALSALRSTMDSASSFNAIRTASRYDRDQDNGLHRLSVDFSVWI